MEKKLGTLGWKSLKMLWVELKGPFGLRVRETRMPREMWLGEAWPRRFQREPGSELGQGTSVLHFGKESEWVLFMS